MTSPTEPTTGQIQRRGEIRSLADTLDLDGDWDIAVTVYRNGRRVATTGGLGDTYSHAVNTVTTNLERGDIDRHIPRRRGPSTASR